MSELSDKIVTGLEGLGGLTMNLEMLAITGALPDDVKRQLAGIATDMAQRIDALRTLARTIP